MNTMLKYDHPQLVDIDFFGNTEKPLFVAEFSKQLPFLVKRQYVLKSNSESRQGGFHAHKQLWQFFLCVDGQCQIVFKGPAGEFSFELVKSSQGIIVPPGYWREYQLAPGSTLSVLASENYDENDYIRDFDIFTEYSQQASQISNVPFVTLDRENAALRNQFLASFEQQLSTNRWIKGQGVFEFEAAFAAYCGVDYAVSCGNGLDALVLSLLAKGIGAGDEVIVPTNSFIATALAVNQTGAEPRFIDALACSGELDISQIESAISQRTKAIIPVHLYGIPVDMDKLMQIADHYDLFVLEDAAQAHGALYKGQKIGSLGHAAAFSFYPTKNLGAMGDGGCLVTNDAELAQTARMIANYGSQEKYIHERLGCNSRLDTLQANFLSLKLGYLEQWNAQRRALAALYYRHLSGIDNLTLLQISADVEPVWHVFPVFLPDEKQRDDLQAHLQAQAIDTQIHYPVPIHASGAYADVEEQYPMAQDNAVTQLSLPMCPFLTEKEILYVCDGVRSFFNLRGVSE